MVKGCEGVVAMCVAVLFISIYYLGFKCVGWIYILRGQKRRAILGNVKWVQLILKFKVFRS